ncbi:MAG: proline dehydrogenase family protein [Thermomicrobiales bacterium]|nr:proline dehydrogenase family protein [Thermomicrobiales bacterium]
MAIDLNATFRKLILVATHNPLVAKLVNTYGMRLGASRFVAGESFDECVPKLRELNLQGFKCNTTILGEAITDRALANRVTDDYIGILDRIERDGIRCNLAVKLTQLGLNIDEELAFENIHRLVAHASATNNFVRIDMEDSPLVDVTLRIYKRLRDEGHDNVGTVLQSYLYRTGNDYAGLIPYRPNLRIVKGAYLESPTVAYPKKSDVDARYLILTKEMLANNTYTAVATHDPKIIDAVIDYTNRMGIPRDRFEFQMLYGISTNLQKELVRKGYTVLIATPHGPHWYFYLMRRLAERPANVLFFLKNIFR